MKYIILILLFAFPCFAEEEPWELTKDKIIYSSVVNGTEFKVYFSTSAFDKARYKVTPFRVEGDTGYLPKVEGYTVVGLDSGVPETSDKFPHLSRLAVSFGDKIVEAPSKLIAHVFMPHDYTSFGFNHQGGRVSISLDGKTVTVELSVGDGAASGSTAFTFSLSGECKLGLPQPASP